MEKQSKQVIFQKRNEDTKIEKLWFLRIQHQFYDKFLIFCYILLFKTKCASVLERSIIDSSARNFPCTEKMFLPLFNSLCEIYFHQVNISYKFPIYFKLSGRSKA